MIRTTRREIATHDLVLIIVFVLVLVCMFLGFGLESRRLNIQYELEQAKIEAECKRGEE